MITQRNKNIRQLRTDHTISICEMKFGNKPFSITKAYADELKRKIDVFRSSADPKTTLMLTFETTYGVTDNEYKEKLVDSEIAMDDRSGARFLIVNN